MVLGLTTPTVLLPSGQVSRFKSCSVYLLYRASFGVQTSYTRQKSLIPYRVVVLGNQAHMHQHCFWAINVFVEALLPLKISGHRHRWGQIRPLRTFPRRDKKEKC